MMKNKNLLIISNYTSKEGLQNANFVKEQVDYIKDYFNKIYIVSPTEFFPRFLKNMDFIPQYYKNKANFYNYKYDNVEVYYPRYLTMPFKFLRKKNGLFAYKVAVKCIEENNIQFDLVHAHFTYPHGFVAAKIKELYYKKVILTVHENRKWFLEEYHSNDPKIYETWSNCDLIVRVNTKDLPFLKKFNKNSIYIPNGVDTSKFAQINKKLKKKLNIPKNKKILVNVGSYKIHHKNQINLIKALNILIKKRDDVLLYLIGRGKDRKKIENKIKELNLENHIFLIGYKPHSEIPIWLNIADLFVLPSYSESFGVVNIESLACGTPVISTINGGSEEIITSNNYGLLLKDPDNYKKLAYLIEKGLNKKWDKQKLIKYSYKFNWKNIANKLIKEYKKLLINYE